MTSPIRPGEADTLIEYSKGWAVTDALTSMQTRVARQIGAAITAQNGTHPDTALNNALQQLAAEDRQGAQEALCNSIERAAGGRKPFTLADIVGTITNTRWVWPGRLARGYINLLAADPGVGKSALILGGIVPRIISDMVNLWPDGSPVTPTDKGLVLWIDTEATQALLLERAQSYRLPLDKICLPPASGSDLLADIALDTGVGRDLITQLLSEYPIHLVIVDSLRGAFRGDENTSEINELMSWLAALARDHQIALLLVHHLKKNGDDKPRREITLDMVRGSGAIVAMSRIVMAIDAPDPYIPDTKRLAVIKSNLGKMPPPIGFEVSEGGIIFAAPPRPPKKETQQDKAADLLFTALAHRPVLANDVYERAKQDGISKNTFDRAKKQLGIESVKKVEGWYWQLPARREDHQIIPHLVDGVLGDLGGGQDTQDHQEPHLPPTHALTGRKSNE